jgi:hypothetical protein
LVPEFEWKRGSSLALLNSMSASPDVVASILPFGATNDKLMTLTGANGNPVKLQDDLGNLLLVSAASRLEETGIGLFAATMACAQKRDRHTFDRRPPQLPRQGGLALSIRTLLRFKDEAVTPVKMPGHGE